MINGRANTFAVVLAVLALLLGAVLGSALGRSPASAATGAAAAGRYQPISFEAGGLWVLDTTNGALWRYFLGDETSKAQPWKALITQPIPR